MEIERKIDSCILNIYKLMPSSGEWPFTVLRVDSRKFSDIKSETSSLSSCQVAFFKRTDFNVKDLVDYFRNSKEYQSIPLNNRSSFIEYFLDKLSDKRELEKWSDNITSIGIGLMLQLAKSNGLELRPAETNISEINSNNLEHKELKVFQLFDVVSL